MLSLLSGPQEDRLVTRARELVSGPLKQKWAETLREAANQLYQNGLPDSVPNPANRFEMKLEDFYAVCDQVRAFVADAKGKSGFLKNRNLIQSNY